MFLNNIILSMHDAIAYSTYRYTCMMQQRTIQGWNTVDSNLIQVHVHVHVHKNNVHVYVTKN